jgi:hypothetical protein
MFTNIKVGRTSSGMIILQGTHETNNYSWSIFSDQWTTFLYTHNIFAITNQVNRKELELLLKQIAQMGGSY